ncbi:MAG: peptidylprolyl isomerase [Rikenellaceae bacterium]
MKIEQNKFVSLAYTLTVDGAVVDKAEATKPLEFIYGTGMLLPKFEQAIADKVVGDTVSFTLAPADGYGETMAEYIVELPKNLFEVDGQIDEKIVAIGNILPMMDNEGNRMNGLVKAIGEETITMDFNHPMSGKTLNFEVEVVGVREATEADTMGGGCGCGDCGCDEGGCNEGGCESGGCGCE